MIRADQLLDILSNISTYQDAVERNYQRLLAGRHVGNTSRGVAINASSTRLYCAVAHLGKDDVISSARASSRCSKSSPLLD